MRNLAFTTALAVTTACGGGAKPTPVPPVPRAISSETGVVRVGAVVDDGQPLARAFVTIGDQTQMLGDDGKARFELPAGEYEGRVAAAGVYETRFKVTVVAGKEVVQNVRTSSVNTIDQ